MPGSPLNGFDQHLPQLLIPREGRGLWVAVTVSLLLHALMVSLFFQGELETRQGPNFPYGECAFGVEQYTALAF